MHKNRKLLDLVHCLAAGRSSSIHNFSHAFILQLMNDVTSSMNSYIGFQSERLEALQHLQLPASPSYSDLTLRGGWSVVSCSSLWWLSSANRGGTEESKEINVTKSKKKQTKRATKLSLSYTHHLPDLKPLKKRQTITVQLYGDYI